jgi:hypothetical protein
MAQLHKSCYPMPLQASGEDWKAFFDRENKALKDLQTASTNLPEGEIVGGLVKWQVADGYAYYLVTKASPLTLQWVPFCDDYQVPAALIRGLRKADIIDMLNRERRIAELFGGKK